MKLRIGVMASLTAITLSTIVVSANAGRANDITYVYFSDASHTTQVGQTEYFCGSGSYSEGEVTQYSTVYTVHCTLGIPAVSAPTDKPYTQCTYDINPYPIWTCG